MYIALKLMLRDLKILLERLLSMVASTHYTSAGFLSIELHVSFPSPTTVNVNNTIATPHISVLDIY